MKILRLAAVCLGLVVGFASHASGGSAPKVQGYECSGAANPDRGFDESFSIAINNPDVGGTIAWTSPSGQGDLGTIANVYTLDGASADDAAVFQSTIDFFSETDVSGLTADNVGSVSKIVQYVSESDTGETAVFRFFAGDTQIGGTFLSDAGTASACLAK